MLTVQTPAVTELHRLSPYAAIIPSTAKVTQPALVAASLLAVPPKDKP